MSRRKKDAFLKHQEGIHRHIYNSRGFQYTAAAVTVFHPKTYAACKKVIHILCLYEQRRYPNRNRKAAELGRFSHIIHQISTAGLHCIVGIPIFHLASNHQPFPVNSGNIAMP